MSMLLTTTLAVLSPTGFSLHMLTCLQARSGTNDGTVEAVDIETEAFLTRFSLEHYYNGCLSLLDSVSTTKTSFHSFELTFKCA